MMRRKLTPMNKKAKSEGMMPLVFFVGLLFVILIFGFIIVVGSAVINYVMDETVPVLTDLGVVSGANFTQISELTIIPLNNVIQQFTWLTGVLYIMLLVGVMGMAIAFRGSPDKWLIGFFLGLILILVLGAMFMSNIYEEFYTGTDDLATRLQEHTILSFMILHSPVIFTIISFIAGIILFSGGGEEGFT